MRILVVGAGATGGYFGGRLLEAKQDVTFLVRPRRAAELAASGLQIKSRFGNVTLPQPPTVLAENLHGEFDLILLSCKAYDLDDAMASFAPAVGPQTLILPVLNGMRHLDVLDQRFGPSHALGGVCIVSSILELGGRIVHVNDLHMLSFGERDGSHSPRVEAIATAFSSAHFVSRISASILAEMWEKWTFIATCAGINSLMRASVGDIVAGGADGLALELLAECAAIAASQGYPVRPASMERNRATFTMRDSPLAASMFHDIERHARVEADHVIGDLLRRGEEKKFLSPLMRVAYAHLKVYEARRARELAKG